MSSLRYTAPIHSRVFRNTLPFNASSSLASCERTILSTREYVSICFSSQVPLIIIVSKLHAMDALALFSMPASKWLGLFFSLVDLFRNHTEFQMCANMGFVIAGDASFGAPATTPSLEEIPRAISGKVY